jgi:alkylhydroperoxidase family enzyme
VGSHARNLQLQGQNQEDVDHIAMGEAEKAKLPLKERLLMGYVKTLTLEPAKVTDEQVESLRKAGWTDDQIAEASFDTAMFAFFNRMAEAYGLDYADRGWFPPELRAKPVAPDAKAPTGKPEAVGK